MLYRQPCGGFAVHGNLSSGYSARPDAFFLKVQNFYKKYLTKGGKNDNILLVLSTSYADVAQLAEQLTCNQQVIGSSPIIGFIQFNIELYYGQIPEWPKGTDCKSAATCFDGSNPSLPITLYRVTKYYRGMEQSGSSPGS